MREQFQRITTASGEIVYRAQPRHPVTGRRISVEAKTPLELAARLQRIKDTRDDLRWGGITNAQAAARIAPAVRKPDNMASVFARYLKTLGGTSRRLADSGWRHHLARYFADALPDELTRERMAAWEVSELEHSAAKTVRNAYDFLAGAMRMAIDAGLTDALPWGDIPKAHGGSGWRPKKGPPKRERQAVATIDAASALIMAARALDEPRWRRGAFSDRAAAVGTLLLTGMRQAEACGLGWDRLEIDQEPFILRIVCQAGQSWHLKHPDWKRPADPTKTKKPRSQILHPTVVLILRAQRAELQSRGWFRYDGPVFPAHGGRWRTTGEVVKPETMRRIAQDAGLPNAAEWVTHSTRHSFATLEAVASRDLKATQARTGHSSIQQLDSYLHAAGLYLGRSAVPELPVHVAPVVATPEPGVEICRTGNPTVKLDSWGFDTLERPPDITETDLVSARSWQSEQEAERRALRVESERSFSDLAAEWLQRPENTRNGYPPAVRLAAKRAYCRAYRVAQRQSCSGAACSKAGQRAGIACRAAWAKQIKAALAKMSQAKPLK